MSRRRISGLDVLGEVRRSMRVLRRVERYLVQQERDAKRAGVKANARMARVRTAIDKGATVNEAFELAGQP